MIPRKRSPRTQRTSQRAQLKRWLDREVALLVKARDGRCRICGVKPRKRGLDWAHIFSRGHLNTRWEPENSVALCRPCHYRYTLRPAEWFHLVEMRMGRERFEGLRTRALMVVGKVDVSGWVSYVSAMKDGAIPVRKPW